MWPSCVEQEDGRPLTMLLGGMFAQADQARRFQREWIGESGNLSPEAVAVSDRDGNRCIRERIAARATGLTGAPVNCLVHISEALADHRPFAVNKETAQDQCLLLAIVLDLIEEQHREPTAHRVPECRMLIERLSRPDHHILVAEIAFPGRRAAGRDESAS